MANDKDQDRKAANVNFDARTGRSELLAQLLNELTYAQAVDDYNRWYKALRGMYYICSPYVSTSQAKEVKDELVKVDNAFQANNRGLNWNSNIVRWLDNTTEKSLIAFRDQFLMSKKDEPLEFNDNEFLGGAA